MNKKLKVFTLLLCFSICTCLFGCNNKENGFNFLYETVEKVTNLDPQLAANDTELQVVYNTFEGLMKYDQNNKLICGVADSYSVSKNGLTYNFKIKEDAKWSDGRPLTAYDFEFAFKRAANPETASPYSASLLAIKNLPEALSGKKSHKQIGVTAVSESELKIELSYASSEFLDLLTTPVAMPCNEDFFLSCKGYYGLNEDSVISNGYYHVTSWNEDYCELSSNKNHTSKEISEVSSVYIYFNSEDELFENIEKNEPHFSILDKNMIDRLNNAKISFNATHIGNTVNSLIINPKSNIGEENIMEALIRTAKVTIPEEFGHSYGVSLTNSVLPQIVEFSEEIVCKKTAFSKPEDASELFIIGCENLNIERIFPTFSIMYIDNDINKEFAQQIASEWQNAFGVSVNITAIENEDALISNIEAGSFDAAIIPTKAISDSPTSYLQNFTSKSNTNYIGYKDDDFDNTIKKMNGKTGQDLKKLTKSAVEKLNKCGYFSPLYITSKTYYFKEDLKPSINKHNQKVYFYHSAN